MDLRLAYVDPDVVSLAEGWIAVGFLASGVVLAYDVARIPYRIEDGVATELNPYEVNAAVALAVEEAARRCWPDGWTYALADAFRLNRRTLQRDRLAKSGLHPRLLRTLGSMASEPDADGMGPILVALARYAERHGEGSAFVDRLERAERAAANALAALREVSKGRPIRPE